MRAASEINNMSGISVILCCYNSANRLPETLQHLAAQELPDGLSAEIVLVNNASTDNTVEMATSFWDALLHPRPVLRIIDEPRPGQNHARKTGVKAAAYDSIVFCDDDNWLSANYLAAASAVLEKDADIGAAGGKNLPVTDALEYPDWFEEYADKYALGIPAAQSGDVTSRGFILGAGMITRKHLFLEMYDDAHPTLLKGRSGQSLSTGDDFEYCKRLLLRGFTLYFEAGLHLHHFIPKERLSIAYRTKLMQGITEAGVVLDEYDNAIKTFRRNRSKSRLRLTLITPFRVLLSKLGLSSRSWKDEQLAFYYAAPWSGNHPARAAIKKFVYGTHTQQKDL